MNDHEITSSYVRGNKGPLGTRLFFKAVIYLVIFQMVFLGVPFPVIPDYDRLPPYLLRILEEMPGPVQEIAEKTVETINDMAETLDVPGAYAAAPADTTAVTFDGWTSTTTNPLRIFTPSLPGEAGASQRHVGKWDDAKYRLEVGDSDALTLYELGYIKIDGLQMSVAPATTTVRNVMYISPNRIGAVVDLSGCILRGKGNYTSSGIDGSAKIGAGSILRAWNNIIYDHTSASSKGINSSDADLVSYLYNNLIQNTMAGFVNTAGTMTAINNIYQQGGVSGDGYSGTFSASSLYNISDVASDQPVSDASNLASTSVTFEDAANDDFHLSSSDTQAKDNGVNLSADANLAFSDDIDGQPRDDGTWDRGPDEYVTPVVPEITGLTAQQNGNAGTVTLSYTGTHDNNLSVTYVAADCEYSLDSTDGSNGSWSPMTRSDTGSEAFTSAGASLSFVWNAETDEGAAEGGTYDSAVWARLKVNDGTYNSAQAATGSSFRLLSL